jgi:hypothetical protein
MDTLEISVTENNASPPFKFFIGTFNNGNEVLGSRLRLIKTDPDVPDFTVDVFDPSGTTLCCDDFAIRNSLTAYSDFGLSASGTYRAVATINDVEYEEQVAVDINQVVAMVGSINFDVLTGTNITISWPAASGATNYGVYFNDRTAGNIFLFPNSTSPYTFPTGFIQDRPGHDFIIEIEALSGTESATEPSQQINASRREADQRTIPD